MYKSMPFTYIRLETCTGEAGTEDCCTKTKKCQRGNIAYHHK